MRDQAHDDLMAEIFRKDPAYAAEFLEQHPADGDHVELLIALRQMTKAFGGAATIARKAKLNRTQLYRMLSKQGNPEIRSVSAILKSMGVHVRPADQEAEICAARLTSGAVVEKRRYLFGATLPIFAPAAAAPRRSRSRAAGGAAGCAGSLPCTPEPPPGCCLKRSVHRPLSTVASARVAGVTCRFSASCVSERSCASRPHRSLRCGRCLRHGHGRHQDSLQHIGLPGARETTPARYRTPSTLAVSGNRDSSVASVAAALLERFILLSVSAVSSSRTSGAASGRRALMDCSASADSFCCCCSGGSSRNCSLLVLSAR